MKLASRIASIEASKTLQVKEKALELQAKGADVTDLTAGEPDFPTPDNIRQAGVEAIQNGFTRYTANTGIPALREAIARKLEEDNKLKYSPDQIIVSNGAKQSILNALFALVEEGDEVLLQSPYWVSYPEQVKIAGAKPVIMETQTNGFKITSEMLQEHITPQTRAIILNSPSNPTGVVYSPQELSALAEILLKRDIWVITDEIYEKIVFDGIKQTSIATLGDLINKSIVVNGFSKAYSMTGWRIGYAAGPMAAVKAMSKIQSHYTSNASSISQKAAVAALTGAQDKIEQMRKTFEERRNYILEKLDGHKYLSYVYPQGAFYLFIKISDVFGCRCEGNLIDDSVTFATYLTEKYHLVTVPGVAFGADDYIRISFATSMDQIKRGVEQLIAGMDRMMEMK